MINLVSPFYFSPIITLIAGVFLFLLEVYALLCIIWICARVLKLPLRSVMRWFYFY